MFKSLAILAAMVVATSTVAMADSISINGSDMYNTASKTITFTSKGSIGGTPTGIFSGFADCYQCVNMQSAAINYGAGFVPVTLFTVTQGTDSLTVFLNSISSISDNLEIKAFATLTLNGVSTPGFLDLTTQGGGNGKTNVTFSATTSTVPEPTSLALFGTGLLGIVGIARRKFNV